MEHHPEKVEWAKNIFLREVSLVDQTNLAFLMSLLHIDEEVPCTDYTRAISSSFHSTSGCTHSTTSVLASGFQRIHSQYSSTCKISKSVHRANPGRWIWGLLTRFTTIYQLNTVLAGKWLQFDCYYDQFNTTPTGESTSLSDIVLWRTGHFPYTRLSRAMRTSFFIHKGDHDGSPKLNQCQSDGSITNAQVLTETRPRTWLHTGNK